MTTSKRRRLETLVATLVPGTTVVAVLAGVADTACIAIVAIYATEFTSPLAHGSRNCNVTWPAIAGTVVASSDQFAIRVGVEVLDLDCAAAVEWKILSLALRRCLAGKTVSESMASDEVTLSVLSCSK